MNKIVYVEDDSEVGNLIAAWLGKHNFEVIVEPRGDRALEVIEAHAPDLMLLDILLPGKDGMTLCRDLRSRYTGPIVLLTSLDSDMNHVLALEIGANNYILKTTPPAVLLARRVRLHLHQNSGAARAGQLSIDAINRQAILDGRTVSLSTADFELLWELACHAGRKSLDDLMKSLLYLMKSELRAIPPPRLE